MPRVPRQPLRVPDHGLRLARLTLALPLLVTLAGCRGDDGHVAGLTPDQFADVIVELREAEREALETDSAAVVYDRLKTEVLEQHGTTEDEIRDFVQTAHRDLPMLDELWEQINRRLQVPLTPIDTL